MFCAAAPDHQGHLAGINVELLFLLRTVMQDALSEVKFFVDEIRVGVEGRNCELPNVALAVLGKIRDEGEMKGPDAVGQ